MSPAISPVSQLLNKWIGPAATRLLLLLLLLGLLFLPVIIVAYVETQTPAVHSKDWLSRALCSAILFLLPLSTLPTRAERWTLVDTAFGLLIVAHLISALLSHRIAFCFLENWQYFGWIGMGWVAYRLLVSVADLRKAVACIALAGVACAVYGLSAYAGHDLLGWIYPFQFKNEEGGRNFIHSFFGNPEYFGGYAAPVCVLCLSRCAQANVRWLTRAGWVVTTLLLLLALGLSGSRGAFLGVLAGSGLLFVRQLPTLRASMRRRLYLVTGGAVAAGIAGLLILSTANPLNLRDLRLLQRFAEAADLQSASSRERLQFYTLTARSIARHPVFGAGLGTFRLDFFPNLLDFERSDPHAGVELMTMELRNRLAEHPHNDYLEFWYELGTFGLACLLLILALMIARFLSQTWRLENAAPASVELQLLNAGLFASAACLLVNAASSFPLHMAARATLFWMLVGCFFGSDERLRRLESMNTLRTDASQNPP